MRFCVTTDLYFWGWETAIFMLGMGYCIRMFPWLFTFIRTDCTDCKFAYIETKKICKLFLENTKNFSLIFAKSQIKRLHITRATSNIITNLSWAMLTNHQLQKIWLKIPLTFLLLSKIKIIVIVFYARQGIANLSLLSQV